MAKRGLLASVAGAAGVIAILTLLSRVVGFGRTVAESWVLGATPIADAYSTANNVPNVLFEVAAGGALAGVVVPLLSRAIARQDTDEANRIASGLLTWVLGLGIPIALAVVLLSGPVAGALLGGRDPDVQDLASTLLTIFAIQVPMYGMSVVLSGILQAHHRFVLPALAPMLSSVVVIGAFVMYWLSGGRDLTDPTQVPTGALMWLGWGTTGGVVAFTLPQAIGVMRMARLRPTFRFPNGLGRTALKMASAGFGGLIAQQTAIVLIMVVANNVGGEGTYPIFKYAQALYFLPYAILAVPIATALFPRISERAALPDRPGLEKLTSGSIRLIVTTSAIGSAVLAAIAPAAEVIFTVVYDMPELDLIVTILSAGVIGYSLLYHTSRVLYAIGAPGQVLRITVTAWLIVCAGVLMALPLTDSRQSTLVVLALANSVGMTVAGALGVRACRAQIGSAVTAGLGKSAALAVSFSLVSAFFGRLTNDLVLGLGDGIGIAIGAAIVGALCAATIPVIVTSLTGRSVWQVNSWVDDEKGVL
ncbi:murein biosynthesis integral membrane protein MurJ [Flaviflexus massiliensis]|uniref:murein biosynthesis integral membrane protein MurJ n=1 Tax=Flaviflexus massiliensis TaxID=1522309 RepID=UPI0006D5AE3D|nr:lipid II flippase MurJ [Flaviflexus massiliensis]